MRVRWLRKALANLEAEAEYIAQDNPKAAANMVGAVATAVERLARHPSLGRSGRVHGTRELIIPQAPYILPYRVRGNHIEILRVFHASRKWPQRL